LPDWSAGANARKGDPETDLTATTLYLKVQDAGLDGTGGALT